MNVAYDLRYADGHFTGIGTHAFALLEALLETPGDERYTVLWNPRGRRGRYDLDAIRRHPRVDWHERTIPPIHPAGVLGLGAWLRAVRPDVYYSPFYLRPVGAPCPVLLTIHDVWPLRMPEGLSRLRHWLYRASLARASAARFIVTSSEFSRREIVELLRVPEARVRAVRLGVPPLAPATRETRPAALPERPFVLVVGDNRPRKNLEVLARAWGSGAAAPRPALVSAGPADPRYPSLADYAKRHGARDVVALGWVGEPELAWLYRHAVAVLFPTLYEGFGFPLVEAFARGLPVIAADIPTLREIGEGVVRFVDPHDAPGWARAVEEVAGSDALRGAMREAGTSRAAELTYAQTARGMLELFALAVRG